MKAPKEMNDIEYTAWFGIVRAAVLALVLSAGSVAAEGHTQQAEAFPEDVVACGVAAGGVAALATATGIGALPAAVLIAICGIGLNDYLGDADRVYEFPWDD